ncbi:MAG: hypothetical protein QOF57_1457 [Frankiaceae bacterium]|nr:hypothetical protein [Frankiaceae bacterium]
MRRIALVVAFLFGLVAIGGVPASATTPVTVTAVATATSVTDPNLVVVSGVVRPATARTVVLQQYVAGKWKDGVSGKSAASGAYKLAAIHITVTVKVRVQVRSGKTVVASSAALVVRKRTVSTVVGSFDYPSATTGIVSPFSGTVTPAERGRVVQVQQLTGATWKTVGTTTTDAAGQFTFNAKTPALSSLQLRAWVLASALRGPAVSAPVTMAVGAPLVGHGALLFDAAGHLTVHELGGAQRNIDMPVADEDAVHVAPTGISVAVRNLTDTTETLVANVPGAAPVELARTTATTCIFNVQVADRGTLAAWTVGSFDGTTCQATGVFLRDLAKGTTKKLAVNATTLALSIYVSLVFDHTGQFLNVYVEPATPGVKPYSFDGLFDRTGAAVAVGGSTLLGELTVVDVAVPSGHIAAFDAARGLFVVASLTSSARPVALHGALDFWDVVGNSAGTKVAYIVGADGAHHLFSANADFSAPVDLGPVPDYTLTAPVTIRWIGDAAVSLAIDTFTGSSIDSTSTIFSAADGAVLFTAPMHIDGWLN